MVKDMQKTQVPNLRNTETELSQSTAKKGLKTVGYLNSFHFAAPLWLHFGTQPASESCSRVWNPNTFQRSKTRAVAMGLLLLLAFTHSLGVGCSFQGPWTTG